MKEVVEVIQETGFSATIQKIGASIGSLELGSRGPVEVRLVGKAALKG